MNNSQPLELCDRRKRKSCDNDGFDLEEFKPDSAESKRSRLDAPAVSGSTEKSTVPPGPEVSGSSIPQPPTDGICNGVSSEDCSSTSGTSGIDVAEKSPEPSQENAAGPSDQCQKLLSEVKLLNDFETFLPNLVQNKLRSTLKPPKVPETNDCPKSLPKSKAVRFDVVREFRFARTQSFVTMPSYGGCSLGMGKNFCIIFFCYFLKNIFSFLPLFKLQFDPL